MANAECDVTLKVLQVIGSMHYGGAEKVVLHLVRQSDRGSISTAVCCTNFLGGIGEQLRSQGVPVLVTAPKSHTLRYLGPLKLLRVLRTLCPDIVHTHGLQAISTVGPLAQVGLVPPWVHTFHYGNYPYSNERWMWMERVFSRRVDRLIAVANSQRDAIVRFLGIDVERINVVPNGVAMGTEPSDPSTVAMLKQEFGIARHKKVVGTVAVMTEQKGIGFLLDAAARIARADAAVHFLLVGGGPKEQEFRKHAESLGLTDVVTFAGWREDIGQLLQLMDIYVMSSLWEAMPLALLEAMAAGRPIVATDVADNAIVLRDGESGLIVPPGDPESLAEAVSQLLGNAALATRMGSNAELRLRDKYSVDRMVCSYGNIYHELAATRRHAS